MLNSVGIPSSGVEHFVARILPEYACHRPPTIVSIGGLSVEEYFLLAERLAVVPAVAALEVNVSCPNLEAGGIELGANAREVERVVRGVVDRSSVPVFAKLTPNVTSIVDLAMASEQGGATAITAINTFVGLAIELDERRPVLGNALGGLSGPAIKPLALRMVWAVARAVSIPVIGVGGIATARDALEFLVVGARVVQVGTATFTRPDAMLSILEGMDGYLRERRIADVNELVGTLRMASAAEVAPELAGAYAPPTEPTAAPHEGVTVGPEEAA
jgi:dihydroorotate dehydrogenase (NAD+) catalytic subunit